MKLTASPIDFTNLLQLQSIVNDSQADTQLENLNAYLFYSKEKNDISIFIKGRLIQASIGITATIDSDFDSDMAIMVYTDNILHLISNYTQDAKNKIVMTIEMKDGKSKFSFTSDTDMVDFPHLFLKDMEVDEISGLIEGLDINPSALLSSLSFGESRQYIMDGLSNCLSFIEDDVRNNAIAIYADKFVANDNRHIYIYDLIENLNISGDTPISLHKKVAKSLININNKKGSLVFNINGDKIVAYDEKFKFKAIMLNSLSMITPPTEEDMKVLSPIKKVFTIKKIELQEIMKFFLGFYTSKVTYKTIEFMLYDSGIKFTLRNSGVVGFNSSHVERKLPLEIDKEYVNIEATVLVPSIVDFLHSVSNDDLIGVYVDFTHRAIILSTDRQKILLPKLK